jgi:ABC-type branched-subunit amino acid transport system substrate-binding protein
MLMRLPSQVLTLGALLAVISLSVSCGGSEEGEPTPAATGTATAATPAGNVPGVSDTEILLGADCPIAGAYGAVYSMIPKASEAYFKYVNETQGGVCGRKIVYRVEDNGSDPAKALEAARKLVEQDKVFAMVGSVDDLPHQGNWDYLNDKGVPDLLVSAGGNRFGTDPEGHPWTVQMIPSYTIEGSFFGQYISENLPGKKVAVLYENSDQGIDELAGLKLGLDPAKNEVVSEQIYQINDISITSQMANLQSSGAEVVMLGSTPGFTAAAIREADRRGWHPAWFMSYVNADDMLFSFVSPELLEGAISFQAFKLADWADDPAVTRHYELMRDYDGPAPANFTLYGQLLAEVAVEILSRSCDNLTREGLMDAVASIKDFHSDLLLDGVDISFSDTDRIALQNGQMLRITLEDGKGKFEYFGPLYEFE